MKTINVKEDVAFSSISIKDAVTMVPLMDFLIKSINLKNAQMKYENITEEDRNMYCRPPAKDRVLDNVQEAYDILCNIGFCGSGNVKILSDREVLGPINNVMAKQRYEGNINIKSFCVNFIFLQSILSSMLSTRKIRRSH